MMNKASQGTGRRKSSVSIVYLHNVNASEDNLLINNRNLEEYFKGKEQLIKEVLTPLQVLREIEQYKEQRFVIKIKALGGGQHGQAHAARLGLSKALGLHCPDVVTELKKLKLLTSDYRRTERKLPGHTGARAKQAFNKR